MLKNQFHCPKLDYRCHTGPGHSTQLGREDLITRSCEVLFDKVAMVYREFKVVNAARSLVEAFLGKYQRQGEVKTAIAVIS